MRDSGLRTAYRTGAIREDASGKLRLDLISPVFERAVRQYGRRRPPTGSRDAVLDAVCRFRDDGRSIHLIAASWTMLRRLSARDRTCRRGWHRLARWLTRGARKYEDRNWERGIPIQRSIQALLRHQDAWYHHQRDEDHAAAWLCNAMFILHTLRMIRRGVLPASLDDRPRYTRVTGIPS